MKIEFNEKVYEGAFYFEGQNRKDPGHCVIYEDNPFDLEDNGLWMFKSEDDTLIYDGFVCAVHKNGRYKTFTSIRLSEPLN